VVKRAKQRAKSARRRAPGPITPTRVSDLTPDPQNRRKRTPRNLAMIADSLRSVGAARSIVIDERNEVLAGNGVVEAAAAAGISKVRVVDVDGDTIIAVRRRGLSPDQKRDLAIADNRAAELAEWDITQLAADQAAGLDLAPFFFDKELDALLHGSAAGVTPGVTGGTPQFVIIVTCQTEVEQTRLLERFMGEGLACRAVVS
jgi:hypothetical protein